MAAEVASKSSAIVVGNGLVGLCIALALSRSGVFVQLIDDGNERAASWGNAGHVATEQTEPLASFQTLLSVWQRSFRMGGALDFIWKDIGFWGGWAARFVASCRPSKFERSRQVLGNLTNLAVPAWQRLLGDAFETHFRMQGHWIVCEKPQSHAALSKSLDEPWPGPAKPHALSPDEHVSIEEALGKSIAGGAKFAGTGQVRDVQGLLDALRAAIGHADISVIKGTAARLSSTSAGASVTLADGTTIMAAAVVVAAGVWSGSLLKTAGIPAPLVAERGYHVGFQNDSWPLEFSPMVFRDRSMVVTCFRDGIRATSFVEFGRPDSPADSRKWLRLEHHLRELGLLKNEPTTRWMGSRPTLPDYLPALGGDEARGIYYAVGHAHTGLTFAAASAELMRDLIVSGLRSNEISGLSLGRFN